MATSRGCHCHLFGIYCQCAFHSLSLYVVGVCGFTVFISAELRGGGVLLTLKALQILDVTVVLDYFAFFF